jgi:oligopeptide/dipeptide ABC transporter ATP-binding protein
LNHGLSQIFVEATLMEVLETTQGRANPSSPLIFTGEHALRVCDLTVHFRSSAEKEARVVRSLSFEIGSGEIVGFLGESGCGKSTTALALLGLLPPAAHVVQGSIQYRGEDLLACNPRRLREIRGSQISIIYQNSDALNPLMRAGDQIMEVLRAHRHLTAAQMREEVEVLLDAVGFDDFGRISRAYPHELSGGQRRRIAIAQALICKPNLVIADEPTAWLDSRTTAEIMTLFARLRNILGTSFLLISHDPETLTVADRIMVMYAGSIIECGTSREILEEPKHPYTAALMHCSRFDAPASKDLRGKQLPCIPGRAPDPSAAIVGCSFASRCTDHMEICETRTPDKIQTSPSQYVCCLKYEAGVLTT